MNRKVAPPEVAASSSVVVIKPQEKEWSENKQKVIINNE